LTLQVKPSAANNYYNPRDDELSNRRCTQCGELGHNKRTCFQHHDGGLVPWNSKDGDDADYHAPVRYDPQERTRSVSRLLRRGPSRINMSEIDKETTDAGKRVIQKVVSARRDDKSQLAEYFLELPYKGDLEDYYDVIDRHGALAFRWRVSR
jgi:hypothetical protein